MNPTNSDISPHVSLPVTPRQSLTSLAHSNFSVPGDALATPAEQCAGNPRNALDGWQQIDTLIGAGSEDGICGALEVARWRGLQPGPRLAAMGSPERPPTHSPDMAERRRVAAMLRAAQSEVRERVRDAEHTSPSASR